MSWRAADVTLTVEIVTPEAALWRGEATSLSARSSIGEFTILNQHAPLVGDIVPSVVRVLASDGLHSFVVHGGFFQVGQANGETLATVLAGIAEPVESVDRTRALAAKERAEVVLAGRSDDSDEQSLSDAKAALGRAQLRLGLTDS